MNKWSELFAKLLGDKDEMNIESTALNTTTQQTSQVGTELTNTQQQSATSSTTNTSETSKDIVGQNQQTSFTREEFNALNARIKELEEANRQLVTQGEFQPEHKMTDEEIIMDLCVGRRRNGEKYNNTVSTVTG